MDKLTSTSREGDFVHAGQEMASAEGFKNVSKKWLDKTLTFEQGFQKLEEDRSKTEDIFATVSDFRPHIDNENKLVFQYIDGREFTPTEHAYSQIANWAGTGTLIIQKLLRNPTDLKGKELYARDNQDTETLKRLLDNGLRRLPQDKKFLWRVRHSENSSTLRAMLTERYMRIDNRWVFETLQKLIPGGLLSHWRGDSDTFYSNILIPDTIRTESDSDYGGMLSVGNSEIGERKLNSLPGIFRAICKNGCIWGETKGIAFTYVHRGLSVNYEEIHEKIKANLEKQIPLLPKGIDVLLNTKSDKFGWNGDMKPLFAEIASENSLPKAHATNLLKAYGYEIAQTGNNTPLNNLFGVIQAITRASQFDEVSSADWFKLDCLGGTLSTYDIPTWDRLCSRAKTLNAEEVDSMFSIGV